MRIPLLILLYAISIFAQDDTCKDFCSKCYGNNSEICLQIAQNCECSITNEPSATSIPLSNVDFGAAETNGQKFSPLANVDFGDKGDDTHTAVLQDNGTYELQNKNRTWFIIGGFALTLLTAIILGIAL